MIKASEALNRANESKARKEIEKEKASIDYCETKLDKAIKAEVNNGNTSVYIRLPDNISVAKVVEYLQNNQYRVEIKHYYTRAYASIYWNSPTE